MDEGNPPPGSSADVSARASEAFSALGNETRLRILLALWEAYDEGAASNALSFSALRERVGMADSGQFSYHLERLVDGFVRRTEAGYRLRESGRKVVQAVVGGVGMPEPDPDPATTDGACPVCGAPTAVSYADQRLFLTCTECAGYYGETDERPAGMLASYDAERASLVGRDILEAYDAVQTRMAAEMDSLVRGVCPTCTGPVDRSLSVCAAHDPDGVCDACGTRHVATARLRCRVCRASGVGPVWRVMTVHPAVQALYLDRGVPFEYVPDERTGRNRRLRPAGEIAQDVVAADPPQVRVTLDHDGGRVAYVVDDTLEPTAVDDG